MLGQCIQNFTVSYGLPFSLFLAGLYGGFAHCTFMCSSFVLAQTDKITIKDKLLSNMLLPYHLGRMTTYVFLAILVNMFINLAFVHSDLKTMVSVPLLLCAGLIFIVSAFPKLLYIFPWVSRIKAGVPYKYLSPYITKVSRLKGHGGRYVLGVLLGFIPCGLVVSALMASATAPNVLQSALAMGAFTLGTMPALMMVSLGGNAFSHRFPKARSVLTRGGMIVSGIWLFALAGIMIF